MEKRSKKKKRQILKLNFNFSDDSGDEFDTPEAFRRLHDNKQSLQSDEQNNHTIVSSEYLCRQNQLPSLSEDLGLPIMDSTHMVVESKGPKRSVCADITKDVTEVIQTMGTCKELFNERAHKDIDKEFSRKQVKSEHCQQNVVRGKENIVHTQKERCKNLHSSLCANSFDQDGVHMNDENETNSAEREKCCLQSENPSTSNSFFEVEVQDFSVQTSFLFDHSVCSKIAHDDSEKQSVDPLNEAPEKDVSSNFSNLSDNANKSCSSLQTSIPCSNASVDKFITAVDDSDNLFPETKLNNSDLQLSNDSANNEKEESKSSTNLSDKNFNTKSDCISSSQEASYYFMKDLSLQTSLSFSEVSTAKVLVADSDTDSSSDREVSKRKDAIVVADSEGEEVPENSSLNSNVSETQEANLVNTRNDCDGEEVPENSSLNSNASETQEAAMVNAKNDYEEFGDNYERGTIHEDASLSFTDKEPSNNSDIKCQMNGSEEIEKVTSSLKALSFHQGSSTSHRRNRSSSSSEDDHFEDFLTKLKGDQKDKRDICQKDVPPLDDFIVDDGEEGSFESESGSGGNLSQDEDDELFYIKTTNILDKKGKRKRGHVEKTYVYYTSSGSGSDSDLSDFIVDDNDDAKGQRNSRLPATKDVKDKVQNVEDCEENSTGSLQDKSKSVFIGEARESERKSGEKKKSKSKTKSTSSRLKSWQSPGALWASDDSDSDDDDFVARKDVTPSKSTLPLPFKTPKQLHKPTSEFETPAKQKVPRSHPWTAPKLLQGSKSKPYIEDDDNDIFFLKSLSSDYPSAKRHPDAARYFKSFKSLREELSAVLFKMFNSRIFDSKIPSTINLEWNARYTKTAGSFSYKRSDLSVSKIMLSVKVCDRPERVRDTLVHELCHAAVRLINGVDEKHGPVWKSWARKVNKAFPFMPVVARCHDYVIHNKYTYQCVNCKYRIGRHSKSLDTQKKVCGHCKSEFQVFLTSELNSSDSSVAFTPKTPRTPNKFALFVKECYSEVKKRNTCFKHGDIMKELSKEFAEKNKI